MMKRLLFILVLIPSLGYGQKIQVKAFVGISENSKPSKDNLGAVKSSYISYSFSGLIGYNITKRFQAGIMSLTDNLSYKVDYNKLKFEDNLFGSVNEQFGEGKESIATPIIPMQVYVDYRIPIHKYQIIAGLSSGIAYYHSSYDFKLKDQKITYGAHLALDYRLKRELHFQGLLNFQDYRFNNSTHILGVSELVGISYKL